MWTGLAWYPEDHPEYGIDPEPLDGIFAIDTLDPSVVAAAADQVRAFLDMVKPADLADYLARNSHYENDVAGQMGHDIFLTRNGLGAGFWDRGLGDLGDRLSEVARSMGEHELHAYLKSTADPENITVDDFDGPVSFDH